MVNVFIAFSGKDLRRAELLKSFLENKTDLNGKEVKAAAHMTNHAEVTVLKHQDNYGDWRKEAEAKIKNANVILFFQASQLSEPSSMKYSNVKWEVETALRYKKPVLLCQDGGKYQIPQCFPGKVKAGKRYTPYQIKDKIEHFDTKIYDIFSEGINILPDERPERTETLLFEQYKMYLQTSEELVSRRQSINQFYLTLNTALMTFIGVIFGLVKIPPINKAIVLGIVTAAGLLFNFSWRRTLDSYKILNTGKMRLINSIEKQLPLKLFDVEYSIIKDELNPWKYITTTESEKNLPICFGVLYILLTIASLFIPAIIE